MKQRITAAELKAMTMKELAAWVDFNACAINRTMVMSWGHEELFKEYHIRPEYIGWKAGRLIVKTFHFTSRTRKADAQSFAEWLHWAIFGEYPAEEVEETEETETEETTTETIEETAEEAKEVATMKKYFKVTFEYAEGIYCTNLAHAETAEDVEREYSEYPWKSIKEAQPWDVEEAKMKGMPIIEVEAAPAEDPEAVTTDTTTEEEKEDDTMTITITNTTIRINFETARETIQSASQRSAWARGVRAYALDLLDDLEDWTMAGDISPELLTGDLDGILRNGAKDWKTYSWGGSALVYDGDICRRLCNNTEKKLTRNGERRPNSREEWLDVQTRALSQASKMVREAVRAATVTVNTTEAIEEAAEAVTVA